MEAPTNVRNGFVAAVQHAQGDVLRLLKIAGITWIRRARVVPDLDVDAMTAPPSS